MKMYKLAFHLEHAMDKIWFDFHHDVLYFGEREGWLGGFRHWTDALTLISRNELAQVKNLAVSGALFSTRGSQGMGSNTQATRIKDLWELIMRKFLSVEEVVFIRTETGDGNTNQGKWDWEETLETRLLRGLQFVERTAGWKAPNWGVVESVWAAGDHVGHFGCFGHVRL
jgi:hypothetical protein